MFLLKLNESLYDLKQGSLHWHSKFKGAMMDRDFLESIPDSCIFVSKYTDGCVSLSWQLHTDLKRRVSIKLFIKSLETGQENLVFITELSIEPYLGANIEQLPEKKVHTKDFILSQPFLVECII